jgi:hypothetical protein
VPGFPILDGPLLILGQLILADATRAVLGDDVGGEELAVLSRALDGMIPGVAGSVVAETLPAANPLEAMIASGAVTPAQVLETGLGALSALVKICQTDTASISRQVA